MKLIHKWDNLLNNTTKKDDKVLQKIIKEKCGFKVKKRQEYRNFVTIYMEKQPLIVLL